MIVIRPCALGDFVLTLPLLHALRGRDVLLVAHGVHAGLARAEGLAAASVDVDRAGWHLLFAEETDTADLAARAPALARRLAQGAEVIAFFRCGSETHHLAANLARAGARRVTVTDPIPPRGLHAADHLLRAAGIPGIAPAVPRLDGPRAHAARARRRIGVGSGQRMLVVHPGAGSAAKRWPARRWVETIRTLDRWGAPVLVSGPADADALRELRGRTHALVAEAWPLEELAALLAGADAVLGHDSGVSHLAAAVGAPVLALFGPTDPARWAPRGPRVRVLARQPLARLDTQEVVAAARELLAGKHEGTTLLA